MRAGFMNIITTPDATLLFLGAIESENESFTQFGPYLVVRICI